VVANRAGDEIHGCGAEANSAQQCTGKLGAALGVILSQPLSGIVQESREENLVEAPDVFCQFGAPWLGSIRQSKYLGHGAAEVGVDGMRVKRGGLRQTPQVA
jgi:hypothetical protein